MEVLSSTFQSRRQRRCVLFDAHTKIRKLPTASSAYQKQFEPPAAFFFGGLQIGDQQLACDVGFNDDGAPSEIFATAETSDTRLYDASSRGDTTHVASLLAQGASPFLWVKRDTERPHSLAHRSQTF